jgi:hypothetical protein
MMERTDAWKSAYLTNGLSRDQNTSSLDWVMPRTASSTHKERSQIAGRAVQISVWNSLSTRSRILLVLGALSALLSCLCVAIAFHYEWRFIAEPANSTRAELLIGAWMSLAYAVPALLVSGAISLAFFRRSPRTAALLLAPVVMAMLEAALATSLEG